MANGPIQSLQDRLTTCKDNLSGLDISNLKEVLEKLTKLLKFSKAHNANQDAVGQLDSLLESLHQSILAPILEAKPDPSFSISEGLTSSLCTLFNSLDAAIPEKSQYSGVRRLFGRVNASSVVLHACSGIKAALNAFSGSIERTDGYHLKLSHEVTPAPTPAPPSPAPILKSPSNHQGDDAQSTQSQAGPSSTNEAGKLDSQVQRALEACPKFRILLLGKSGAGKSSLLNKVFGVSSASTSDYERGQADINQEHTSSQNPYFAMHDSMGFESGSQEKYEIVRKFLQERSNNPNLTERVHAVWLCAATPVSGGRMFETGDEQIFDLDFGDTPLIVVFTQFDNLVVRAEMLGNPTDSNLHAQAKARAKAEKYYVDQCINPLKKICVDKTGRSMPPYTRVSVQQNYESTLSDLIKLTHKHLPIDPKDNVPSDLGFKLPAPSNPGKATQGQSAIGITWSIAQRADPVTKIEAVIEIGRQRYWWSLTSGLYFNGHALRRCISVIHDDIVQAWNFLNPDQYLVSDAFKGLMSTIVANANDVSGTTMKGDTVGRLAADGVFATWIDGVYGQTPQVVRSLMAYIVDTTVVMQKLFHLMREKGGIHPVTKELIDQAANEYYVSEEKRRIHLSIEQFAEKAGILEAASRGAVFALIKKLILSYQNRPG